MRFHRFELIFCQRGIFIDDGFVYKHFADIVQQGGKAQIAQIVPFHVQSNAQSNRQNSHIDAVVIRIVVISLQVHQVDEKALIGIYFVHDVLNLFFYRFDIINEISSALLVVDEKILNLLQRFYSDSIADGVFDGDAP